jgi:hypothetical protein
MTRPRRHMVTIIAEQERHQGRRGRGDRERTQPEPNLRSIPVLDNDLRSDPKEGIHTDEIQKLHPPTPTAPAAGHPGGPPTRGRPGARSTPTHYSGSPSPDTDTRLAPDNPGSAASWVGVDTHERNALGRSARFLRFGVASRWRWKANVP